GEAAFTLSDGGEFASRITRLPATASTGTEDVARDDRPTGTYVFNVLPARALPDTVSMIRVSERPSAANAPEGYAAGTAIVRDKEIWSFSPLGLLRAAFAPIAIDGTEHRRADLEADPERRRILSWLMRRHFEGYLERF